MLYIVAHLCHAQAESLEAVCDAAVQPLLSSEYPGILDVRVYADGESFARTYQCGEGAECEDRIFEIGSISKAVTGVILARLVEEGRMKLDAPLNGYLPEGITAPKVGEREIVVLDVATHCSGLPRMPRDISRIRGYDAKNPYAGYGPEEVFAYLPECKPKRGPGDGYEYSNYGFALLGNVLARTAGKSYEELLHEYIAAPLGLKDFTTALDAEQAKRFVSGFDKNGRPAGHWDLAGFAAAGGIRATADDVMAFLRAAMAEEDTALLRAMRLSMTPRYKASDRLRVGLGWHVTMPEDGGEPLAWHNGETGGFHSYTGVLPESKVAVVVLGNVAAGGIDQAALEIISQLTGRKFQ